MNSMISALVHHQSSFAACETKLQTLQTSAESVQYDIKAKQSLLAKLKSNNQQIDNRERKLGQLNVAIADQEDQLHRILQQSHQVVVEQKKALGEAASVLQQIWSELNQPESTVTGKQAQVQPVKVVECQAQYAHNVQVHKLRASNVMLHLGQLKSDVQLREMRAAKLDADCAQVRQLEADLARKDRDLKEQTSKNFAMKMANSSAMRKIELQHMDLMNANQREKLEVLAKTARDLAAGSARLALTRIQIQRLQQEGLERDAELSDAEELNASLEFELAETMANLVDTREAREEVQSALNQVQQACANLVHHLSDSESMAVREKRLFRSRVEELKEMLAVHDAVAFEAIAEHEDRIEALEDIVVDLLIKYKEAHSMHAHADDRLASKEDEIAQYTSVVNEINAKLASQLQSSRHVEGSQPAVSDVTSRHSPLIAVATDNAAANNATAVIVDSREREILLQQLLPDKPLLQT